MAPPAFPLTRIVRRDEVPPEGLVVRVAAKGAELEALAVFLGLSKVERFECEMTFEPWRRVGLTVRGRIDAQVEQTCVVTLEPFSNPVEEEFEDYYAPDPAAVVDRGEGPMAEEIEPLVGQRVDAGALAVEQLAVALDPHPRRPDAVFEGHEEAVARENPFAKLEELRSKMKSG